MSMLIKKWFNVLSSDKLPGESLKGILRPYEIQIDKRVYDKLDNLVIEYVTACYYDPTKVWDSSATDPDKMYPFTEMNSPFKLDAKKLQYEARAILNFNIMEAISEVWSQFGVRIETAKSGPAVRTIRLCRAAVKERLMKRFENIINEFEKTIQELIVTRDAKPEETTILKDTTVDTEKTSDETKQEEIAVSQE